MKDEKLMQQIIRYSVLIALLILTNVMLISSCDARSSSGAPKVSGTPIPEGGNSTSLTWDVPQKRTDGSTLTNIKGYKIYYGKTSLLYSKVLQVEIGKSSLSCQSVENVSKKEPDKRQCSYVAQGFGNGVYYFSVTAYDDKGNESDLSNEVTKQLK